MNSIELAIREIGIQNVALECGVTKRAVYKWITNGSLPQTEFFGGTNYAQKIQNLSKGKFKASELLEVTKNKLLATSNDESITQS